MNNLPLNKLNRDEVYTFIAGLFVSQSWFFYLISAKLIEVPDSLFVVFGITLWIGLTAIIFIFNNLLSSIGFIIKKLCAKSIKNKVQNIERKLLYYTSYLTEVAIFLHLFSLTFISLLLISIPLHYLIGDSNWMCALYIIAGLSLIMYLVTYRNLIFYYECIDEKKCDVIDQTQYIAEVTKYYSRRKIEEIEALEKLNDKK